MGARERGARRSAELAGRTGWARGRTARWSRGRWRARPRARPGRRGRGAGTAGAAAPFASTLLCQQVPGAPHGLHISRVAWIRLDFLPQAAHVHVDGAVECLVRVFALDQLEELIAGKDAPRVPRQRHEQVVLVRREALPDAFDTHFASGEIDAQPAGFEYRQLRVRGSAPEYGPDA